MTEPEPRSPLDWIGPVKALALLGVMLNHLVEQFGSGPWFTNPSNDWPPFAVRMQAVFPDDPCLVVRFVRFLGWLGDSAPGVFILLSGFGLTLSALRRPTLPLGNYVVRRATRIYPLYLAAHVIVLTAVALSLGTVAPLLNHNTVLSLLGLRCTESTFFYLCPAWWFVWLILQLYLVFPLLLWVLRRWGAGALGAICCSCTFVSRAYGLLYSRELYFWMTGIFFGTRLAEFAAGMLLAVIVARERDKDLSRFAFWCTACYPAGFALSLTWVGALFSNLLVSIGLTAFLYLFWERGIRRWRRVAAICTWAGAQSYGAYLLHQNALMEAVRLTPLGPAGRFLSGACVALLSFPAAWALRRLLSFAPERRTDRA